MANDDFKPVYVGDAWKDSQDPARMELNNRMAGIGAGTATSLLHFVLTDKEKKGRLKRMLKSLGWGTLAGGLTYGGLQGWDYYNGRSWAKDYKRPGEIYKELKQQGKDGTVDFNILVNGAGSKVPEGSTQVSVNDKEYGKGTSVVANRKDLQFLKDYLREIKDIPNYRIRIAGHSQGGKTAYDLARWAAANGINIDRLVTTDPVFRFGRMEGKPETTKDWVNYYPNQREWRFLSDLWAILGGAHKGLKGADNRMVSDPTFNDHSSVAEYSYFKEGNRPYVETKSVSEWPEQWWTTDLKNYFKGLLGRIKSKATRGG